MLSVYSVPRPISLSWMSLILLVLFCYWVSLHELSIFFGIDNILIDTQPATHVQVHPGCFGRKDSPVNDLAISQNSQSRVRKYHQLWYTRCNNARYQSYMSLDYHYNALWSVFQMPIRNPWSSTERAYERGAAAACNLFLVSSNECTDYHVPVQQLSTTCLSRYIDWIEWKYRVAQSGF